MLLCTMYRQFGPETLRTFRNSDLGHFGMSERKKVPYRNRRQILHAKWLAGKLKMDVIFLGVAYEERCVSGPAASSATYQIQIYEMYEM